MISRIIVLVFDSAAFTISNVDANFVELGDQLMACCGRCAEWQGDDQQSGRMNESLNHLLLDSFAELYASAVAALAHAVIHVSGLIEIPFCLFVEKNSVLLTFVAPAGQLTPEERLKAQILVLCDTKSRIWLGPW